MPRELIEAHPALPESVLDFLSKASERCGEIAADRFEGFLGHECSRLKSPIEQLFLIALHLVCDHNFSDFHTSLDLSDGGDWPPESDALLVVPQWKVERYAIDFALRHHPTDRIICVELDGHEFHDRDERQRRYEKQRDRHLASRGYTVLHFTGSEVVKDACTVALEAYVLAANARGYAVHPFET